MINSINMYSRYAHYELTQNEKSDKKVIEMPAEQAQKNKPSISRLATANKKARNFFDRFHTGQSDLENLEKVFRSTFKSLFEWHLHTSSAVDICEEFKNKILLKTLSLLQSSNLEGVRYAQVSEGQKIANKYSSSIDSSWNYFNSVFLFQKREATAKLLYIAQSFAKENDLADPTTTEDFKNRRNFNDKETTRWVINLFDFPDNLDPPRNFSLFHCRSGRVIISGTIVDISPEQILSKRTTEEFERLSRRAGVELSHLIFAISIMQYILKTDNIIIDAGLQVQNNLRELLEQVYRNDDYKHRYYS